ncbi:hypothetical protein ACVWYF_003896 [Hymenobacter sp. UYAg731]
MQPETNVRFLIAVKLTTPTPEVLTFTFQRDFQGRDLYPITLPSKQFRELGAERFLEYVADTYLAHQPAEAIRVTRSTILFTLIHGM